MIFLFDFTKVKSMKKHVLLWCQETNLTELIWNR